MIEMLILNEDFEIMIVIRMVVNYNYKKESMFIQPLKVEDIYIITQGCLNRNDKENNK